MDNSSMDVIHYCEEDWPSEEYRKVFGAVTTIVQFVLPFIIISICYIWVSKKLNARTKLKPGYKSSRREEADRERKKRTNIMLISMVAVFGLSWLPLNVVNILGDFFEQINKWTYYNLVFFVTHAIAMSSTCYNPFLYAWLNENFRKEFKHVLPCFNPSNDSIMGRMYNRSERNTCGPKLQDAIENITIIPDGSFISNDNSNDIIGISKTNYQKCVNILLSDDGVKNKMDKHNEDGNDNVLELKSNEIPFISSSDNNATSTSNLDNSNYGITDIA
uniref:G-protein coupled receptors family 1 profile domain-containing protein n=1 Tax=Megaselia scalaris TaxID=36166 RepID=T1GMX3_MEGSC